MQKLTLLVSILVLEVANKYFLGTQLHEKPGSFCRKDRELGDFCA